MRMQTCRRYLPLTLSAFGGKSEGKTLSADLYNRLFAYFQGHVGNKWCFRGVRVELSVVVRTVSGMMLNHSAEETTADPKSFGKL